MTVNCVRDNGDNNVAFIYTYLCIHSLIYSLGKYALRAFNVPSTIQALEI